MSPERQAIIEAIHQGNCTPKAIGDYVGKLPQTISKLLYLMAKQGAVQKSGYGNYSVVEGSTKSIDSIESSIAQALLTKVESIENRLSSLEVGQGRSEPVIEPSIDSSIDSTLEKLQTENEVLQTKNADLVAKVNHLESKLEAVQTEAQTSIDSLTLKLNEATNEIQRQSGDYNKLHEKYTALKGGIDDGNAPVKSTSRKSLTLNGEAEYIIDTDKAKERVIELTKEGLEHKAITQQLESEGYRTKGLLGDVKPYLQGNIGKWQKKFNQTGKI